MKLPNSVQSLDAVVQKDGRNLGPASIVSVSNLFNPLEHSDQSDVPWRVHVLKDYRVQKAAVAAGVLNPKSALAPHWALEVLRDPDPSNDNYTVMTLTIPSPDHIFGFNAVGIIRPDVVYFEDGEPHC